jgi:hypothetical protein
LQYAAADAWGTLSAYSWLRQAGVHKQSGKSDALPAVAVVEVEGGGEALWQTWQQPLPEGKNHRVCPTFAS